MAVVALVRLICQQFADIGPEDGAQQTRLLHLRTAQGDNALAGKTPGGKELPDGDNVLVVEVPDLFCQADRLKKMDVSTHQPCRMRPGKGIKGDASLGMAPQLAAARLADMHPAVGQTGEQRQSGVKVLPLGENKGLRIGAKRVGVDSGDKNRGRGRARNRDFAEGTRAQGRPEARVLQLRLHGLAAQRGQGSGFVAVKFTLLFPFYADDHRLQYPALAPVDGHHGTACRSSEAHTGILFIFKQRLPFENALPFLHQHGRAHPDIVIPQNRNLARGGGRGYLLLWNAGNRQIKSFSDSNHNVNKIHKLQLQPDG